MAVKGAKTIAQFKILEFIDNNFVENSLEIYWNSLNSCTIMDINKECMNVTYEDGKINFSEPFDVKQLTEFDTDDELPFE